MTSVRTYQSWNEVDPSLCLGQRVTFLGLPSACRHANYVGKERSPKGRASFAVQTEENTITCITVTPPLEMGTEGGYFVTSARVIETYRVNPKSPDFEDLAAIIGRQEFDSKDSPFGGL